MTIQFPETGPQAGIGETDHSVRLTLSTRLQIIRGLNLCVGFYHSCDSLDMTVAGQRIGTHDVETHFGTVRAVLAGNCQFRFWESAEACIGLIREYGTRPALSFVSRSVRGGFAGPSRHKRF
jgi:hypothetical protein